MKSLARRIKRKHVFITESEFITNRRGEKKLTLHTRTRRGRWLKSELN